MGHTSKIFHLRGTTLVWCFFMFAGSIMWCKDEKKLLQINFRSGEKMSFSKMLEILQDEDFNKIVLKNVC